MEVPHYSVGYINSLKEKFYCPDCGRFYTSANSLRVHQRRHAVVTNPMFKCQYCINSFTSTVALRSHQIKHQNDEKHLCTFCGEAFYRRYMLARHTRIHTDKTVFKCTICYNTFNNKEDLVNHTRRHSGDRYCCDECDEEFRMVHLLAEHKRNKHDANIHIDHNTVFQEPFIPIESYIIDDQDPLQEPILDVLKIDPIADVVEDVEQLTPSLLEDIPDDPALLHTGINLDDIPIKSEIENFYTEHFHEPGVVSEQSHSIKSEIKDFFPDELANSALLSTPADPGINSMIVRLPEGAVSGSSPNSVWLHVGDNEEVIISSPPPSEYVILNIQQSNELNSSERILCPVNMLETENLEMEVADTGPIEEDTINSEEVLDDLDEVDTQRKKRSRIKCEVCDKIIYKSNYREHMELHSICIPPSAGCIFDYRNKCLEGCDVSYNRRKYLIQHLNQKHNKNIQTEKLALPSFTEFETWLETTSLQDKCIYVKKSYTIGKLGTTSSYLCVCATKSKTIFQKINMSCTSHVVLYETNDTKECFVEICRTHYGHATECFHDDPLSDIAPSFSNNGSSLMECLRELNHINPKCCTCFNRLEIINSMIRDQTLTTKIKQSHVQTQENMQQCLLCEEKCHGSDQLRSHHEAVHDASWGKHESDECEVQFNSLQPLKKHERHHDRKNSLFKCKICKRGYRIASELRGHERRHHRAKRYLCGTCGDHFYGESHLIAHMRSHNVIITVDNSE